MLLGTYTLYLPINTNFIQEVDIGIRSYFINLFLCAPVPIYNVFLFELKNQDITLYKFYFRIYYRKNGVTLIIFCCFMTIILFILSKTSLVLTIKFSKLQLVMINILTF